MAFLAPLLATPAAGAAATTAACPWVATPLRRLRRSPLHLRAPPAAGAPRGPPSSGTAGGLSTVSTARVDQPPQPPPSPPSPPSTGGATFSGAAPAGGQAAGGQAAAAASQGRLDDGGAAPDAHIRPYGLGTAPTVLRGTDGEPLLHVVLAQPQIPGNTGTIGRLCLGLSARLHLVHPLGFSTDAAAVRRAGLDYWRHVDVVEHPSWTAFAAGTLPRLGDRYYYTKFASVSQREVAVVDPPPVPSTTGKGEGLSSVPPPPPPPPPRVCLVFGGEVAGFTPLAGELNLNAPDVGRRPTRGNIWLAGDGGQGVDRGTTRGGSGGGVDGLGGVCVQVAFPMHAQEVFRSFNLASAVAMAAWDAYRQLADAVDAYEEGRRGERPATGM
ncbi:hypothetical protein MMPV_004147 [Pyropia vietnamensis]